MTEMSEPQTPENFYTVIGDDEAKNLKVNDGLGLKDFTYEGGVFVGPLTWWIGYARTPEEALSKCEENLRKVHPDLVPSRYGQYDPN